VSILILMAQPDVGSRLFDIVWIGTFGSALGTTQLLQVATPLLVTGCAVAIAQRGGMWNLGAQGQLLGGAWLASAAAFAVPDLPGPILVPVLIVVGMVGGALWMLVPALARAYLRVDEVITTLMLNFVAALWLTYWALGPWHYEDEIGGGGGGALYSRPVSDNALLPQFTLGDTAVSLAVPLAVLVALVCTLVFRHTHYGYRANLLRSGDRTASYAGIDTKWMRLSLLLLSGAVAGIAGVFLMLDQVHGFSTPLIADNPGYIGIIVALLAANSFIVSIPMAVLMAFLVAAGNSLLINGVSPSILFLITGLILLIAACETVLQRRRVTRGGDSRADRSSSDIDQGPLAADGMVGRAAP
jgi:ABC-type uncharacterized transport system permease subunit